MPSSPRTLLNRGIRTLIMHGVSSTDPGNKPQGTRESQDLYRVMAAIVAIIAVMVGAWILLDYGSGDISTAHLGGGRASTEVRGRDNSRALAPALGGGASQLTQESGDNHRIAAPETVDSGPASWTQEQVKSVLTPVRAFALQRGLQDYSDRKDIKDVALRHQESIIEKMGGQIARQANSSDKNYFHVLLAGLARNQEQLVALEAGAFLAVPVDESFKFYKSLQRAFPELHFAYIFATEAPGVGGCSIYTVQDRQHDRYSTAEARRAAMLAK